MRICAGVCKLECYCVEETFFCINLLGLNLTIDFCVCVQDSRGPYAKFYSEVNDGILCTVVIKGSMSHIFALYYHYYYYYIASDSNSDACKQ